MLCRCAGLWVGARGGCTDPLRGDLRRVRLRVGPIEGDPRFRRVLLQLVERACRGRTAIPTSLLDKVGAGIEHESNGARTEQQQQLRAPARKVSAQIRAGLNPFRCGTEKQARDGRNGRNSMSAPRACCEASCDAAPPACLPSQ